jgi:hypothetical protein
MGMRRSLFVDVADVRAARVTQLRTATQLRIVTPLRIVSLPASS